MIYFDSKILNPYNFSNKPLIEDSKFSKIFKLEFNRKMMKPNQSKYLKEIIDVKRKELISDEQYFDNFDNKLSTQIKLIKEKWEEVIVKHRDRKNKLILVILAEAPLSFEKYFYNKAGTFLNGLKNHYTLNKNSELPEKLLEEGILLLDIYELPIPSDYFRADEENILFDHEYFEERIKKIYGLIGDETRFVFRYKQLFEKKKLYNNPAFEKIKEKLLMSNGEPISIFIDERSQKINEIVLKVLTNN